MNKELIKEEVQSMLNTMAIKQSQLLESELVENKYDQIDEYLNTIDIAADYCHKAYLEACQADDAPNPLKNTIMTLFIKCEDNLLALKKILVKLNLTKFDDKIKTILRKLDDEAE